MFQGSGYDLARLAIPAILSGLLAWLYASLTKVGKAEHEKAIAALEKQLEHQAERHSKFEAALNDKVSRAELKESMHELKDSIQQMRLELKEDFQTLRSELRKPN